MILTVALVGCGRIADGHLEEIGKLGGAARVVAVCDREPLMAAQAALRHGVARHYDDFDRMLDEVRPDVVHVTTPPASHLPLATRAIEAGCHVYVEKPLCPTHAEAQQLVQRAVAARRLLTVGYTYLFDPPALAMRRLIAEGTIGETLHVESIYGYDVGGPFGAALLRDDGHWVRQLPGQLIHNNIDHLLNKIVDLLGEDDLRVHAAVTPRPEGTAGVLGIPGELRLLLAGRRRSAYGTFSCGIRPARHAARVCGTRGTLAVDYVTRTVTLEAGPRLPSAAGRLLPAFDQAWQHAREGGKNLWRFVRSDFHYFAGLRYLMAATYRAIADGAPPPIPYRDILRTSALIDEVVRQTAGGATAS